ncbi:hypothetical protein ACRS3P_06870 [Staphylococcus aureus]
MQVGVANKEAGGKSAYNNVQVGGQHREIGTPISTDNASWRQHREIGFPISTGNGSWGVPNIINH